MRYFFNLQQKTKTVILLMVIVTTVIASSFWENSSITRLTNSFSTIYKDRLIPANEIFHINDLMYQKQMLLEKHMEDPKANPRIAQLLDSKNNKIDSILHDYEQTYLVADESKVLSEFKVAMKKYEALENDILHDEKVNTAKGSELTSQFNKIHGQLLTLSQIQTRIGEELYAGSARISANYNIVHYFQVGVIFMIMLIIQLIIINSRSILPKKPQRYELN